MSRPSTHQRHVETRAKQFVLPEEGLHEDFPRGPKEGHIQMIAIGGASGVGLFLGSVQAIRRAGPSLRLSYSVAGRRDLPDHASAW